MRGTSPEILLFGPHRKSLLRPDYVRASKIVPHSPWFVPRAWGRSDVVKQLPVHRPSSILNVRIIKIRIVRKHTFNSENTTARTKAERNQAIVY